ncbi:uncharacterized protein LOC101863547 [Aplysia californica]|uniref:Uncharacterized protein LOC101863547 n=1 Tax=Aplysia californica TaxID=6500 RepID=A0ABM0K704_APLCA|nr:uncharacterized protein LOC101863547 [Aplysia californica]
MAASILREEFRLKHFRLNHHNDRAFYCGQWKLPHIVFVLARVLLAGYSVYAMIHLVVNHYENGNKGALMRFFTVWSYILLMIHLVYAALLSIVFFRPGRQGIQGDDSEKQAGVPMTNRNAISTISNGGKDGHTAENGHNGGVVIGDGSKKKSPTPGEHEIVFGNDTSLSTAWYFKLSWVLSNFITCAAPVVTIIFFVAIYPKQNKNESSVGLQDLNVHALNFVFVVVDHLISARPVRLLHAYLPIIYGLVYIIFSVIYWSTDHKNHVVYEILDWNKPGIAFAVTVGLAVVAIPLLQFAFFGLYRLKLYICKKVHGYDLD